MVSWRIQASAQWPGGGDLDDNLWELDEAGSRVVV